MTRPDVISEIHTAYLDAGARIIETNSFNSNAISLLEYGLQGEAAHQPGGRTRLAHDAADRFMHAESRPRGMGGGSVGPTSKSLSMAQSIGDADTDFDWDVLAAAYFDQMKALIGVG